MSVINLADRMARKKFIPIGLTPEQKIEVLDLAQTPEGWDKSSFLCAKREMKKVIRGHIGRPLNYPKEFMFLNDLLNHVEARQADE